jgi:hypothetical protein
MIVWNNTLLKVVLMMVVVFACLENDNLNNMTTIEQEKGVRKVSEHCNQSTSKINNETVAVL